MYSAYISSRRCFEYLKGSLPHSPHHNSMLKRGGKNDMAPENLFPQAAVSATWGERACQLAGGQRERSWSSTRGLAGVAQRVPWSHQPWPARSARGKSRDESKLSSKGRRVAVTVGIWQSHWHSPEEKGHCAKMLSADEPTITQLSHPCLYLGKNPNWQLWAANEYISKYILALR